MGEEWAETERHEQTPGRKTSAGEYTLRESRPIIAGLLFPYQNSV